MPLFLSCLCLSYLALVAQVMGVNDGLIGVSLSAIVIVVVSRSYSPPFAGLWSLLLGFMVDGLGTGPIGVHAALWIVLAVLLPRLGFAEGQVSVWRWTWAVFLVAWWDGAISAGVELVPRQDWPALEDELLNATVVAALTSVVMAVVVSLGSAAFSQRPAARHG